MVNDERDKPRRLIPAPSVHARVFDDELVILDMKRGEYMSLDAIGAALWQGLEQGRAVAEIARDIVAEYDVSFDRAVSDLEALSRELVSLGLLVTDPNDA